MTIGWMNGYFSHLSGITFVSFGLSEGDRTLEIVGMLPVHPLCWRRWIGSSDTTWQGGKNSCL